MIRGQKVDLCDWKELLDGDLEERGIISKKRKRSILILCFYILDLASWTAILHELTVNVCICQGSGK